MPDNRLEYIIWKSLIYYRSMWLITFCRLKLSVIQRKKIKEIIADISYSCGATTDDLLLPETLAGMHGYLYIRTHDCSDPIEKFTFLRTRMIHCVYTVVAQTLIILLFPMKTVFMICVWDCFYDMWWRLFLLKTGWRLFSSLLCWLFYNGHRILKQTSK